MWELCKRAAGFCKELCLQVLHLCAVDIRLHLTSTKFLEQVLQTIIPPAFLRKLLYCNTKLYRGSPPQQWPTQRLVQKGQLPTS